MYRHFRLESINSTNRVEVRRYVAKNANGQTGNPRCEVDSGREVEAMKRGDRFYLLFSFFFPFLLPPFFSFSLPSLLLPSHTLNLSLNLIPLPPFSLHVQNPTYRPVPTLALRKRYLVPRSRRSGYTSGRREKNEESLRSCILRRDRGIVGAEMRVCCVGSRVCRGAKVGSRGVCGGVLDFRGGGVVDVKAVRCRGC